MSGERLQSGPVIRAARATLIPVTRLTWTTWERPVAAHATLTPVAVVVIGPEGEGVWRLDGTSEPLDPWLEAVPGLARLIAACR